MICDYILRRKKPPVSTIIEYDDPNNTSIVAKIQFGETTYLFTGDMERKAELDLIESGADLSADVLKVGHHGSSTSSFYAFLNEVLPTAGIISTPMGTLMMRCSVVYEMPM